MDLFHFIIYSMHFLLVYGDKLLTFEGALPSHGKMKSHSISRRDVNNKSKRDHDSSICKDLLDSEAEKRIIKHLYPIKNDRNMDLKVIFVGEGSQTQLVLTTTTQSFLSFLMNHHSSSKLYRSTDGGRTFQILHKEINSASIRSNYGIMKSPLDHNWVILISYTPVISMSFSSLQEKNSFLLISKDGCKNFTSVSVPFKLRSNEPALLFHPKKKSWIIGLEEKRTVSTFGKVTLYGHAYISKDFGKTWNIMKPGYIANTVKWGSAVGKEGDEIYLLATKAGGSSFLSNFNTFSSSSKATLWRSLDGGDKFEKIMEHCFKFGVEGNFVFASVIFNVSTSQHRVMHVSKDSGFTFRPVNVPGITSDRFYSVLEMHKGMMFLHVDESGDTGKGTLYMSDADGLIYTKSLDNHFYTNSRFTDFTKIDSMQGVYITQVLSNDNTLKSVITFDRGASWKPLYVDKEKYCNTSKECTLHFHKEYSNSKTHSDIQGPLSSTNAPGIIFIHGQAGDALTGTAQVWLSTNGGYNWTKIADDPHHYAIADSGNLLLVIPRLNNTGNILRYSIDQGRCWHTYKFQDNNEEMVIRNVITESHAKERTFSLWGYAKGNFASNREWIIITINFHGMFPRKCQRADLEEWSPHTLNGKGGCFLGERLYFARPKLSANCYLGKDFTPSLKNSSCKCTKDDLECDYGYEKDPNGVCKENKSIKPMEICRKGEKIKVRFSQGYRKIPGDVCKAENAINDVVKYIDEEKKCEPIVKEIDAFGVVKEEKELAAERKKNKEKKEDIDVDQGVHVYEVKSHQNHRKGHTFFLIVGVIAVIAVVVGVGWVGIKYIRNNRYVKPTYVMSDLLDEELNENMFDPRPKSLRQYRDETDAEDDDMLPV